MARVIDLLVPAIPRGMRQQLQQARGNRFAQILATLIIRRIDGAVPEYVVNLPPNLVPAPFSTSWRPTVLLQSGQFVLGASTAAAERAVADGPRWEPTGALIPIMRQLPADMVYLSVSDPRVGTPVLSMALPVVVRQINAEIALGERRPGKVPKDVYLRLDPEIIPPVEDLNRRLFPSSTTITVDRGGPA